MDDNFEIDTNHYPSIFPIHLTHEHNFGHRTRLQIRSNSIASLLCIKSNRLDKTRGPLDHRICKFAELVQSLQLEQMIEVAFQIEKLVYVQNNMSINKVT